MDSIHPVIVLLFDRKQNPTRCDRSQLLSLSHPGPLAAAVAASMAGSGRPPCPERLQVAAMREVRFLHPILSFGRASRHLSAGIQVESGRRSRIPGILPITSHIHWISWPAVSADDGAMTISSLSTEMSFTRTDRLLRCKDLRTAAVPLLHEALPRARQPHKQSLRRPRIHRLSICALLPAGEDSAAIAKGHPSDCGATARICYRSRWSLRSRLRLPATDARSARGVSKLPRTERNNLFTDVSSAL